MLEILASKLKFLNSFYSEYWYIEIWFTGQNFKLLEMKDRKNLTFIDSYMHRKWYILSKPNFKLESRQRIFTKSIEKKLSSKYGHPTIQYKKLSNRGTQNCFQKCNPKSSRINWLFSWKKHCKSCFKEYWWWLQANRRYLHKQIEYQLEYYYEMSKERCISPKRTTANYWWTQIIIIINL